jgi:hypothetical protein
MKLPTQATPVFRTATGVIKNHEQPITVMNFTAASRDSKLSVITKIVNGANYNAPMRFLTPFGSYGCHMLSENSMAMCLAALGRL